MTDRYVIWSFEHGAWWAPGRYGYTEDLPAAGRYSKTEADAIVDKANHYSATIKETAMSEAAAAAFVADVTTRWRS